MKIAVSGANGFVGRAVLRQLADGGHQALPLVRRESGLADEIITGDLSEGSFANQRLHGCDAIIHLAARTHVLSETAADPQAEYRRTNVEGTARLLDAAIAAGVPRFVFMSSAKAVGEWSHAGEPLRPDTAPRPEDAYGVSKLEAEMLVRDRCETAAIGWVILRPPLVHGIGVQGNMQRLLGLIQKGIPLPLGAVRNARSIVAVRNLAAAAIASTRAPGAAGKVLHIADLTVSTPELVREIARSVDRGPRLISVPTGPMVFASTLLGRGGEARRLFGSLELETASSWKALGIDPPFEPRAELRAAMQQ